MSCDQSEHGTTACDQTGQKRLLVVVVSWNRPHFLRRTLESLFQNLAANQSDVIVVDNGSGLETITVISEEKRISQRILLPENTGINAALEAALPRNFPQSYQAVLVSDADMEYLRPIHPLLSVLHNNPQLGAISLQHSPEHPVVDEVILEGQERWLLKAVERGCSLLFLARRFQRFRPLPNHKLLDFDWWVMRDAPDSIAANQELVAVLPGAARHLGWRAGDSTWQSEETPEFEDYRV